MKKRMLLPAALMVLALTILSLPAYAQCVVTDWHTGAPVAAPVELQNLSITCPGLLDRLPGTEATWKLIPQFEPSGLRGIVFQAEPFRDRIGVRVPFNAGRTTRIVLYEIGYGNRIIEFTPPAPFPNPVLGTDGTIAVNASASSVSVINGGTAQLPAPRLSYILILYGEGFGNGGTWIAKITRPDGTTYEDVVRVFPPSSGLTRYQIVIDLPREGDPALAPGTYLIKLTDPENPGVESNTISLTLN